MALQAAACCLHIASTHPPLRCLAAVTRILGVPEEGEVAIVGTLYKEMKLKVGGWGLVGCADGAGASAGPAGARLCLGSAVGLAPHPVTAAVLDPNPCCAALHPG